MELMNLRVVDNVRQITQNKTVKKIGKYTIVPIRRKMKKYFLFRSMTFMDGWLIIGTLA
jgi:hypothetical protein